MFQRSLPLLLCVWVLAGCRDGDRLSDFYQRKLLLQVTPVQEGQEFRFSARLATDEPEAGCRRLDSGVTATLNGEPLSMFPGSETPDPDGPCGSPVIYPNFHLRDDAARFVGPPRDGLLEIRDGDERIVAEFRNLLGRHTLARREAPLTVKPGQEVFLAWDPPTDVLSEPEPSVELLVGSGESRIVKAVPESGGLRVTFPVDLPAGTVKVGTAGVSPRLPLLRCEGIETCDAGLESRLRDEEKLEVTLQP